ncbi:hypothetical protein [Piscirickettsia litoralis]|nr:hypothetical protein [Piscirickettsia litoralis]
MALGAEVPANNPNNLMRSHVGQTGFTSVDPYSGVLSYHIPLVNIPENDGLSFYFALNSHLPNGQGENIADNSRNLFNLYPHMLPGLNVFVDQYGRTHNFKVSNNKNIYYSIDHWKEVRSNDWYIYTPDGVTYTLKLLNNVNWSYWPFNQWVVTEIKSKNGETTLTYNYDVRAGTIRNGVGANSTVLLTSITTDDNKIKLNYSPYCVYGRDCIKGYYLTNIKLNDKYTWRITSLAGGSSASNIMLPTKLTYPDGSIIKFNIDGGASQGSYSALHSITYSDGGKSDFTYSGTHVTQQTNSGPGVTTGTWNYSYAYPNGTTVTTVTGPNDKRELTFNGRYPNSNDWNTGLLINEKLYSADGKTLYQTIDKTWKEFTLPDSTIKAPELTKQVISRGGDCKMQSCMEYITEFKDFDSYGYPKTEVESSVKHTV